MGEVVAKREVNVRMFGAKFTYQTSPLLLGANKPFVGHIKKKIFAKN